MESSPRTSVLLRLPVWTELMESPSGCGIALIDCVDDATVMQGREEIVYALFRDVQQKICGWSMVVSIHANYHHTNLAKQQTKGTTRGRDGHTGIYGKHETNSSITFGKSTSQIIYFERCIPK